MHFPQDLVRAPFLDELIESSAATPGATLVDVLRLLAARLEPDEGQPWSLARMFVDVNEIILLHFDGKNKLSWVEGCTGAANRVMVQRAVYDDDGDFSGWRPR